MRTSMHGVLPPYLAVSGPGEGMEPRTPQKRTVSAALAPRDPALLASARLGFRAVFAEELNEVT